LTKTLHNLHSRFDELIIVREAGMISNDELKELEKLVTDLLRSIKLDILLNNSRT
jgi:hypothetical protein